MSSSEQEWQSHKSWAGPVGAGMWMWSMGSSQSPLQLSQSLWHTSFCLNNHIRIAPFAFLMSLSGITNSKLLCSQNNWSGSENMNSFHVSKSTSKIVYHKLNSCKRENFNPLVKLPERHWLLFFWSKYLLILSSEGLSQFWMPILRQLFWHWMGSWGKEMPWTCCWEGVDQAIYNIPWLSPVPCTLAP